MVEDAAKIKDLDSDKENQGGIENETVEHRKLESKEDIRNYIKGLM